MNKGPGVHNQDPSAPVALTLWKDGGRAVEEALELCDGLANFERGMKVYIKPNLVEYLTTVEFSPYGVITTSVVLEALVRCFKDAGASEIVIAEAALSNPEFKCGTKETYQALNYETLRKKYGVKLVDLNDYPFDKTSLNGFSLSLSQKILGEAEFLVNVPVLKTHEQTKVSLGFKNNKGCLNARSKSICHHRKRPLDEFVARLGERLYPQLTVIDGIYSLAMGPMHMGKAYRENLVVASRDMFSADCLGAQLLGYDPADIGHLAMFAEYHGRSLKPGDLDVKGLDPKEHVHALPYIDPNDPWYVGEDVTPLFYESKGVKGFRQPHPGQTLCTGCSLLYPLSVLFVITASILSGGKPYDNYELLGGKTTKPSGTANKTFLLGDCIIAANRKGEGIKEAVPIPGCPASLEQMITVFNENGIKFDGMKTLGYYFHSKAKAYGKKPDLYNIDHYMMA